MSKPYATTESDGYPKMRFTRLEASRALTDRLALARSLDLKAFLASAILVIVILGAFFGGVIWRIDPFSQQLGARLLPPLSAGSDGVFHMFGTDHLGRDLLARSLAGARISLLVALMAVSVAAVVGVSAGLASGFFGGRLDHAIMTCVDVQLALPFTLIAISIATITGPSLVNVIFVLTATGWVAFARVVRSQVLSLRETDFIAAARSLGCGSGRLLVRYLLPNCASTIVVIASFAAARMIIAEATISFLGVGVPSWIPSWGSMISEGRTYLPVAWWVAIIPGGAITLSVISINLLGDCLRDRLDPRLASPNGLGGLRRINGGRRPDGERARGVNWQSVAPDPTKQLSRIGR